VPAVSNDCRFERLNELGARFERFPYGFRASRIMIAGVNAILIDGRGSAHDAERIEKVNAVTLFYQANGRGCAVDSRSGNGDFCSHEPLCRMFVPFGASIAVGGAKRLRFASPMILSY